MKILSINNAVFHPVKNVSNQKKYSPVNYQSNTDSVSFKSYNEALLKAVTEDYTTFELAEKSFGELIEKIKHDKNISKNEFFDTIYDIYERLGLRDMFSVLTLPFPVKPMENLIKTSENSICVELAKKDDKPLFTLLNLGRKGLLQTSTKLRDIRLGFTNNGNRNSSLTYSTDKKGDFMLSQSHNKDMTETEFYQSTGTPKVITYSYAGGKPDITYYNKDGEKSFFKNWFFGGPAIEPIY